MIIDGEKVPVGQPAHVRRGATPPPARRSASCRWPTRPTSTGRSRPRSAASGCGAMPCRSSARAVLHGAARLLRERAGGDRAHRDAGGGQDPRRGAHRSHDERRPVRVLRRRIAAALRPAAGAPERHALDRGARTGRTRWPRSRPGISRIGNPGRKLGAPIAAGCSVILKAAEETPASALGGAAVPARCGAAQGSRAGRVRRARRGVAPPAGSPIIRKLSFTGSTVVGKHLMKLAAEDCKRTTMELGGHGAGAGVRRCRRGAGAEHDGGRRSSAMRARFASRPTRFIVQEDVLRALPRRLHRARAAQWRVGNGLERRHADGPDGQPAPPGGDGPADRRRREGRARSCTPAASASATRASTIAPTVLSEVPLEAAHHERGAVRPGRAHQPVRERGGDDRRGQPPALRPRRLRLDQRRRSARSGSRARSRPACSASTAT